MMHKNKSKKTERITKIQCVYCYPILARCHRKVATI